MTTWIVAVPEGDTVQYMRSPYVDKPYMMDRKHLDQYIKPPEILANALGDVAGLAVYDAQRWDVT